MAWLAIAARWVWNNFNKVALLVTWALAGGVFAWAARASKVLQPYAPLSWLGVGLAAMSAIAVFYRIGVAGYRSQVNAQYNSRLLARGGAIDPMAKTFERKRIFLNEFALPSHPLIEGKTFIDCQIIGPANIILATGNRVDQPILPVCDAVVMGAGAQPLNGFGFANCTFRGCSLQRITLLIPENELAMAQGVDWLNWITPSSRQGAIPPPTSQPSILDEAAGANPSSPQAT